MNPVLGYILHSVRLKNLFIYFVCLISCLYLLQIFYTFLYYVTRDKHPVVLWWTPLMGDNDEIIHCSSKYSCLLTKDRSNINNTNLKAILFYGSELELPDLPIPKTKKWAIFHEESPRNKAFFLFKNTFEVFDIISTFSRNSDLPLTLQYLQNSSILTDKKYMIGVEQKNKFLSTIAPVLYIQSDCDTPNDRDAYVRELMKYIQVDSYGGCLNNKKFPEEISKIHPLDLYNEKVLHFVAKYKFVIAFENGICEDYITEKLWRPLMVGSIPIYMGSPSVQDWLPNKNSAILVQNFKNPQQLAQYVKLVNGNNNLYNKFLEHKMGKISNQHLIQTLVQGPFGLKTNQDHPISAFECYVCEQIHEDLVMEKTKSVYDCDRPKKGNSWEYYWHYGECQSKALVDSVKNGVKLKADPCG